MLLIWVLNVIFSSIFSSFILYDYDHVDCYILCELLLCDELCAIVMCFSTVEKSSQRK